jgi:copper transport protein
MRGRLRWLGGLLALGLWAIWVPPVFAHAVLQRADPPPNASLQDAPRRVTLWFTEPVDPTLSSITVMDRDGTRVSGRTVVTADRLSAQVPLPAVADGIFAVQWRVLSTVDGHATSGIYLFAVGLSLQLTPGGPATQGPDPMAAAVRWIALAAAMVITGSVTFPAAVLHPARAHGAVDVAPSPLAAGTPATARVQTLGRAAIWVLLASVAARLLLQGAELLDAPIWRVPTSRAFWTLLVGTKSGWSALLQSGLALLLLIRPSPRGRAVQAAGVALVGAVAVLAAVFGGFAVAVASIHTLHLVLIILAAGLFSLLSLVRRPGDAAWIPVLAAGGILGGITMTAHAAGAGALAIAADWLHLAAAGIWIGGLASLMVVVGTQDAALRRPFAQAIIPRFSTLAGAALAVLIVTGAYSTWVQVPALQVFTDSSYGRTLLVKLVIVVPLLALAAVNRFVLTPLVKREEVERTPLVRTLLRIAGGEVALGATILAVVAVLTLTPPARVTWPGPTVVEGPHLAGFADGIRVALVITPAEPGWNRFEITARQDGQAIEADARLLLRVTKLDEQLDPVLLRAAPQGSGRHVVEGGAMAVPGWWDLEVIVRRPGRADVATSFPLRLGEASAPSENAAAVALVDRARREASAWRSWRERLQLADGRGGVALTEFAIQAPDRMHYQTPDGTEAIVIGRARYVRTPAGSWEQDALAQPFGARGPLAYLQEMRGTSLGRRMPCRDEACQVVLWEWDRTTAFAALIGLETGRVHRILMAATGHFMTVAYTDFNRPIRIVAPR